MIFHKGRPHIQHIFHTSEDNTSICSLEQACLITVSCKENEKDEDLTLKFSIEFVLLNEMVSVTKN